MEITTAATFGRSIEDGTVFVRTPEGERIVGQYKAGTPHEGLLFFARKYVDLLVEADVMLTRLAENRGIPGPARALADRLTESAASGNLVGDLALLIIRSEELKIAAAARAEVLNAKKKEAQTAAVARRKEIAEQAEKLADSTSWKSTHEFFTKALEEWKNLSRFDRKLEQELWKTFSHARSSFDKRRRTHFAEAAKVRNAATEIKTRVVAEAEKLKNSSDWIKTSNTFKSLMDEWKKAGRIGRGEDEKLWATFKSAQDEFFTRKKSDLEKRNASQLANLEKKRGLLVEAEAVLPIKDIAAAKKTMRDIHNRWEKIGHVPRDWMQKLEDRLKLVETAIKEADIKEVSRKDPDKQARANSTLSLFTEKINKLEKELTKAQEAGNSAKVSELITAIEGQKLLLSAVEETLTDFAR